MAIRHANPGEVIDVRPLRDRLAGEMTRTLVKTKDLEVLRIVMPRGKRIRKHTVPGEITLQCLEGSVRVDLDSGPVQLVPGDLLYLDDNRVHDLAAVLDSSVLVTILLAHKPQPPRWPSVLVEELNELQELGV